MKLTLHDSKNSLPSDLRGHILVFTGFAKDAKAGDLAIITEVQCTYYVGNQLIEYKRNSDAATQRFEDALDWAVRQSKVIGVTDIHAVFELNRPIEIRLFKRMFPNGFIDKRRRANRSANRDVLPVPAQLVSQPGGPQTNQSPLRRHYIFRNRKEVTNRKRHATLSS